VLSIINGGGKWVELTIEADPIYQTILIAAEKAFWQAVKTGETPALFDCEPQNPDRSRPGRRHERFQLLSGIAGLFATPTGHADHELAKSELKALIPEEAKEADGHGVRAKRSKSGAISFELGEMEAGHASIQ
jgi:hypothetical protein